MAGAERSELLGLEFERSRATAIVERCLTWCDGPRVTHIILTANASHLCLMRRDPRFGRRVGLPIWSSQTGCRSCGRSGCWADPWPERVAGIDLMTALLAAGSTAGLRVYFLGATTGVVEALVAHCRRLFPGLVVVGSRNGYFTSDDHEAIVEEVRASRPHLLFVGMPSPMKDLFCQRYRDRLQVPVVMGVGGSFDVLAGFIRRAPRALQVMGLEWAWRLTMEPRKLWKRYLTTNGEFIWLVLREVLRGRSGPEREQGSREWGE